MNSRPAQQIACQQVLQQDNSVFSMQWTDLPAGLPPFSAHDLLQRYLRDIRQLTIGLIRPVISAQGISFLLCGRWPLLSFLPPSPASTPKGDGLALRICGGLLVQRDQCERGELLLLLSQQAYGGQRITLRLADYCPLLLGSSQPSLFRRWLYRLTQSTMHRLVTVRFLVRLYRDLAGPAACVRIVNITLHNGRET